MFISVERLAWIKLRRQRGRWREGQDVINNMAGNFRRIAKMASVKDVSLHDFRRSCLSNWARKLPAPVVQQLAGHSDIQTTMRYYISVREHDLMAARDVSAAAPLLDPIGTQSPVESTA